MCVRERKGRRRSLWTGVIHKHTREMGGMLCQDNQLLCTMRYVFLGHSIGEKGGQVYTIREVVKVTNIDANFYHFFTAHRITHYC